jgi:hypothetical protein
MASENHQTQNEAPTVATSIKASASVIAAWLCSRAALRWLMA